MIRQSDPIVRRILAGNRARARIKRRVDALIAFLDAHPETTRAVNAELRRLDDLLGEAGALWRAL